MKEKLRIADRQSKTDLLPPCATSYPKHRGAASTSQNRIGVAFVGSKGFSRSPSSLQRQSIRLLVTLCLCPFLRWLRLSLGFTPLDLFNTTSGQGIPRTIQAPVLLSASLCFLKGAGQTRIYVVNSCAPPPLLQTLFFLMRSRSSPMLLFFSQVTEMGHREINTVPKIIQIERGRTGFDPRPWLLSPWS